MFETFTDRKKRNAELWERQNELWKNIWLLFGATVLLFIAMSVLCVRLWLLLRSCHRVT